jgi:hypothetical protein
VEKKAVALPAREFLAATGRHAAAIRDTLAAQRLPCRAKFQLRRKSTNPKRALRDERRELGIIFRNSAFCKALCFYVKSQQGRRVPSTPWPIATKVNASK